MFRGNRDVLDCFKMNPASSLSLSFLLKINLTYYI